MKNFIQPGDYVAVAAPATVLSGQGMLVGALFGVATTDAQSGADVEVATRGVFELPAAATDVIAIGDKLYWDSGAGELTKTSAGNTLVGVALSVAPNGVTLVHCRLNGAV